MVAKYVPPHRRNQQADAEVGPATRWADEESVVPKGNGYDGGFSGGGRKNGGWNGGGQYDDRAPHGKGGSRFDCLKHGLGNKEGGKSRGGPNDYEGVNEAGDDWWHRRDGRRLNSWDTMSEFAVFGERRQSAGINFDDYDKIPVQISGSGCEQQHKIEWFSEAHLTQSLMANLDRCGYERPTPVQKHAIPMVCDGRDVMACAQTGSGKTCAFMVPAIECLLRSGPPLMQPSNDRSKRPAVPCALVMAPTRELATQIFEEARKFAYNTGIRCCVVYGGADIRDQRRELMNGCDVLVATPGRLTDMYDRGHVSLAYIQFLILDEADRMLDMGFEPQVRQIVEHTDMGKVSSRPRQSMMFSATFPKEVQMMARDFLHEYVFITVGRVGSASELVEQSVVYADDRDKVRTLEDVLQENRPEDGLALIFVETKRGADLLERDLYRDGFRVTAIHGDRSQIERENALAAFRSGRSPIMIATDVASRGLDIPNVNVVVNYDMPKSIDDYVHRIGRTGRAGRKGKAIAFVNDRVAGPLLRDLLDRLDEAKQEIPSWFEEMCRHVRWSGGGGSRGRKGGGGGNRKDRFGGHDVRNDFRGGKSDHSGWRGGGNGGGGGGYPRGDDHRDRAGNGRW